MLGAILCLWKTEGRFDYYQAAKKARVLAAPFESASNQSVAFTGKLGTLEIGGRYIEKLPGYLQVQELAEIYSWERTHDDDGDRWSKGWHRHLQRNNRNTGLNQTIEGNTWQAVEYHVGDFTVSGDQLRFVDASVPIPPANVTFNQQGKQSGLVQQADVFYKRNPQGEGQLGDERLTILGISAQHTVSYFGRIQDGMAVGKQFRVKEGFISKLIRDDGMLHHLVNGDRETALQSMKSHIQKIKWMVRLFGTGALILGQLFFWGQIVHLLIAVPILGRFVGAGILVFSIVSGLLISMGVILVGILVQNLIVVLLLVLLLVAVVVYLVSAQRRSRQHARNYLQATASRQTSAPVENQTAVEPEMLNSDQLHKSFKNLVKISLIDGELDDKENNFLADWARSRNIPDETIVTLFDEAKREKEQGLEATSYEDLHFLITLSMMDGNMSTQELRHITDLGQKLGMNQQQIRATIKKATLGELGVPAV